jgi:hypothetical protein
LGRDIAGLLQWLIFEVGFEHVVVAVEVAIIFRLNSGRRNWDPHLDRVKRWPPQLLGAVLS